MIVNFSKKNAFFSSVIVLSALCTSCGSNEKGDVTHHSVNPFDTTQLQSQLLTDEDRSKLAMASGKRAKIVNASELATRIQQSTDKLHVYCFWDSQNEQSVSTLKAIQLATQNQDSNEVQVIFVNLSQNNNEESVNLFIRENQLSDETLLLEKTDFSFFNTAFKKNISTLPVVILVNKAADIFSMYNKPIEQAEFQALMQPFL